MLIFVYLAILIPGVYWVIKTLGPEMAKPPLTKKTAAGPYSYDFSHSEDPDNRIKKLETLLSEKNKNISFLQKELRVFYIQVQAFDKVKTLLEEEVHRLREQNRIFRSEPGMPPVASSPANTSELEKSRTQ